MLPEQSALLPQYNIEGYAFSKFHKQLCMNVHYPDEAIVPSTNQTKK